MLAIPFYTRVLAIRHFPSRGVCQVGRSRPRDCMVPAPSHRTGCPTSTTKDAVALLDMHTQLPTPIHHLHPRLHPHLRPHKRLYNILAHPWLQHPLLQRPLPLPPLLVAAPHRQRRPQHNTPLAPLGPRRPNNPAPLLQHHSHQPLRNPREHKHVYRPSDPSLGVQRLNHVPHPQQRLADCKIPHQAH
jgi:hypothetical protein